MITIVDYGMGNLGSIRNMLTKIGAASEISSDPRAVMAAQKLILPGVGAFDAGMQSLERNGLRSVLDERVLGARVPTLGICLGMQLMTRHSAEGDRAGLGWIDAQVLRFEPGDAGLKVPHMGWNLVAPARPDALLENLPEQSRFYFVHSYYVACADRNDVLLTTSYGRQFDSGLHRDNVWGVQFHPEKSHKFGMQLLTNFANGCV
ncbi:imidazole glycerol phosphate synthase subunit HisH 2 [Steroidobacter agaridevorans]|uniref:Imidazole glycerol phosphate synthase subunit HisH n=1 Tax=Steroidobacter agaridevorans TaxID=2695856 RepID=A0A829YGS9_9GAMM|nr:imidazole glycerol phosphate synthase subunit HisH [Steroidobacter agaridevorans]GFE82021.1 imidazole glycerol phosphate synthase subunit HisH 2 [Steroidobacter agaridevorans]GFE85590.1 imidazole glycerol phosphate synthase subunit HisH 2 [Steroidobacter agaridevorans]